MTDEPAVRRLTEGIIAKGKRVDVLVNAVGGYSGVVPLWETDLKSFEQMLALNVWPGFVLARVIVPVMLKQRSGVIVNVASRAAVDHAAGAAAYAASKAAAVAMIDCLAADLKGTGVRANSVLPSIIDTGATRKAMPKADFSKWPKPADIARVNHRTPHGSFMRISTAASVGSPVAAASRINRNPARSRAIATN